MTQAIITKYMGPTNSRISRIKATAWGGSVTVPYTHDLKGEDAPRRPFPVRQRHDETRWGGGHHSHPPRWTAP